MEYQEFLETKQYKHQSFGKDCNVDDIHPMLFDFQKDITAWAVRKGCAALFLDTGLGKTYCQLEWIRNISDSKSLIVAPLSVSRQTVNMAKDIDLNVLYVRSQNEVKEDGIYITNYEMIDHFDPSFFDAVVLDESSILKAMAGKTRKKLIDMFCDIPHKLACTATPSPNDQIELGNHAEFLNVCKTNEMLAMFFIHANKQHEDIIYGIKKRKKMPGKQGQEWRLKNHAKKSFYRWMSSWAISMKKPSDLGYDDKGFDLPALNIEPRFVTVDVTTEGSLFFMGLKGVGNRAQVRKSTLDARLEKTMSIILDSRYCFGVNLQNHVDEKTKSRVQQGLLSRKLGEGKNTLPELVSCEQGQYRQGSEENIPPEILHGKQREIQKDSRSTRNSKSKKEREICVGCRTSRKDKSSSQEISTIKSESQEKATIEKVQYNIKRVQSNVGISKSPMPDLWDAGQREQNTFSDCRPRSSNGESEGNPLHEMQSRFRAVYGQSDISNECCHIPQWVVWCGLDQEQKALEKSFQSERISFSSIYGKLSPEEKQDRLEEWLEGKTSILLTKSRICGFGLNLEVSHNMLFFGMNDSFEQYYQCIRREYRYGQTHPVNVYIILSTLEQEILINVQRKERMAENLHNELIVEVREYERSELRGDKMVIESIESNIVEGQNFKVINGDSCVELPNIPGNSIDLSVYSPPFADLYTYTSLPNDLGNSRGWDEFFDHYSFIIKEVLRVTKTGRISCVHTSDIPAMDIKDGYIGIRDFPGRVIAAHEKGGWIFHGRAIVTKNPQAQAIRTHSKGLLFAQLRKDSTDSRPCLLDHILIFKKEGQSEEKVSPVNNGEIDNERWIDWAGGIWTDIRESDVLKYQYARKGDDEKHICPLQLGTIERCIKLYSNPGDTILTPFLGIGSEAYQALKFGRKAIGIELKKTYFDIAVQNLNGIENYEQGSLFAGQHGG